jgi:hypothetical protein
MLFKSANKEKLSSKLKSNEIVIAMAVAKYFSFFIYDAKI